MLLPSHSHTDDGDKARGRLIVDLASDLEAPKNMGELFEVDSLEEGHLKKTYSIIFVQPSQKCQVYKVKLEIVLPEPSPPG